MAKVCSIWAVVCSLVSFPVQQDETLLQVGANKNTGFPFPLDPCLGLEYCRPPRILIPPSSMLQRLISNNHGREVGRCTHLPHITWKPYPRYGRLRILGFWFPLFQLAHKAEILHQKRQINKTRGSPWPAPDLGYYSTMGRLLGE